MLALLVARAGRLVTREDLFREIWGESYAVDQEQGLNFAIHQIRTVLGDTAREARYIETEPRAGYRFVASVRPLPSASTASERKPATAQGSHEPTSRRWNELRWAKRSKPLRLGLVAVGLLVAFGVVLGAVIGVGRERPRGEPTARVPVRLAVIPFSTIGADQNLADGVTLDLIAHLGRLSPSDLTVIGRRSIVQFRDTAIPASEIGRQLQVNWVVEGQVQRQGDRIRVDAMVVDAADDSVVWSWSTSVASMRLSESLQEVAARIASHLLPVGRPLELTTKSLPLDNAAYSLYAEARWQMSSGRPENRPEAIAALRELAQIAPTFAAGHAALAAGLTQSAFGSSRHGLDEAWTAARTAHSLAPASSEAHFALGLLETFDQWDLDAGRRFLDRAIELDPGSAQAMATRGVLAALRGDAQGARQMADLAVRLDPASGDAWIEAGYVDYLTRRFDVARDRCERGISLGTTHRVWSALCLLNASQRTRSWEMADRAIGHLADALGLEFDAAQGSAPDRVDAIREALILRLLPHNDEQILDFLLAAQHAALGRSEEALGHLERSLQRQDLFLPLALRDPSFDPLRPDPRLREIFAAVTTGS